MTKDETAKDWNICPECDVLVDLPGGEVNQPGERFSCRNCGTKLVAEYVIDKDNVGRWILLMAEQYDNPKSERRMGGPFVGANGAGEEEMLAGLDPGIRRTVAWLRARGFDTTDSGDGRTKFDRGFTEDDGVCPFAHVAIGVDPENLVREADRLADLLREEHGIEVEPTPPEGNPPQIDAGYCAASGSAMLMLLHVDDSMLKPE